MANTNKMLIGSLEALRGDGLSQNQIERSDEVVSPGASKRASFDERPSFDHRASDANIKTLQTQEVSRSSQGNRVINPVANNAGDKLKESLLRVSREHYKYVKRSEALEKKVYELRTELETANVKIRDLKQELEEYRDGSSAGVDVEKAKVDFDLDEIENPTKSVKAILATIDEKFVLMLKKNTLDVLDTLLNMRRILSIATSVPSTLVEADVARHFLTKDVCSIFDVAMISIFVLQSEDAMMKYTLNNDPEAFVVSESRKSITGHILKVRTDFIIDFYPCALILDIL
jgi:hypothetical protein